tara:strand:- start:3539 stop:3826 length:288 start_codon:yes stop_codon:yes gene_type:complete
MSVIFCHDDDKIFNKALEDLSVYLSDQTLYDNIDKYTDINSISEDSYYKLINIAIADVSAITKKNMNWIEVLEWLKNNLHEAYEWFIKRKMKYIK